MSVLKFLLALLKKGNMMEKEDTDKSEGIEEACDQTIVLQK